MKDFLRRFKDVRVLVFGDVMLDQYWWGSVDRISPEAPVPIVNLSKKSYVAGGAANVAVNIKNLGAEPLLFGVIGNDSEAANLKSILEKQNLPTSNLFTLNNLQTTTKTRIVGHNQQIVRIDQETRVKISDTDIDRIWYDLSKKIEDVDIILISDYAKGCVDLELLSRLITKCNDKGKKILVDPKGKNFDKYKNSTIITPNQKEALEITEHENYDDQTFESIGNKLITQLSLEALLITRGEEGMTLFQKGLNPVQLKATARKVFDVTGAGDTVIATLAVALGSGATFLEAAQISNTAAGLVVEKMGTTPVNHEMLEKII
jgi:D-beta-D-heptose 7-phosphate kinase/D-beta-D-heptose 1-phosphate adenosyltransferase